MTSLLSELAILAIERNEPFEQLIRAAGIESNVYRPLPEAPPLCFIHLHKTGGAAVIEWLKSMFDGEEVAPCRSPSDFDALLAPFASLDDRFWALNGFGPESRYDDRREFRLYAGHIPGKLLGALPDDTQLFTIVRDPVEMAISAYYHLRHDAAGVSENAGPPRAARGYDRGLFEGDLGAWFQRVDFVAALSSEAPLARLLFRDVMIRHLGAGPGDEDQHCLADDSTVLEEMRRLWWRRATVLLETMSVVGEHAELDTALLLLAAIRGWPAPPPLPKVHDYGAPTRAEAAVKSIRRRFRTMSPFDFPFYDLARDCSRGLTYEIEAICGAATPESVDRHHVRRFFETAVPVPGFDVRAKGVWNGCGWSLCEREEFNNFYRKFADGQGASILVALDPSLGDFRFFAHIWHASSADDLGALTACVGGTELERTHLDWRSGALIAEWRLPAEIVSRLGGNIEVRLERSGAFANQDLWFARLGCLPLPEIAKRPITGARGGEKAVAQDCADVPVLAEPARVPATRRKRKRRAPN
jgi:hypothetical protein